MHPYRGPSCLAPAPVVTGLPDHLLSRFCNHSLLTSQPRSHRCALCDRCQSSAASSVRRNAARRLQVLAELHDQLAELVLALLDLLAVLGIGGRASSAVQPELLVALQKLVQVAHGGRHVQDLVLDEAQSLLQLARGELVLGSTEQELGQLTQLVVLLVRGRLVDLLLQE